MGGDVKKKENEVEVVKRIVNDAMWAGLEGL